MHTSVDKTVRLMGLLQEAREPLLAVRDTVGGKAYRRVVGHRRVCHCVISRHQPVRHHVASVTRDLVLGDCLEE